MSAVIETATGTHCPLCSRVIDPSVLGFHVQLEERINRILRTKYPEWAQNTAACPDCVHEAVQQAINERSEKSIHDELLLPFPVYSRDQARLLPTPIRTNAHPKFKGRGITIAFLDSGFYPHPDLTRPQNRILRFVDATFEEPVEKDHFRRIADTSWHGLMTSCVAAGNGYASDGIYRGIASEANLVLVKTGNRRGRGIRNRDIYRALAWAIENQQRFGIRIVNISLGGDRPPARLAGYATELDLLVEDAVARGMVIIAASGNGGVERIIPPASAPSAITVGGVDDQNSLERRHLRMFWSNYGYGVNSLIKPEVTAPAIWLAAPMLPGTWVHNEAQFLWRLDSASDEELDSLLKTEYAQARFRKETLRQPLQEIRRAIRRRMAEQKYIHPHYQHVDGTSMAAPIVSSIVAQMLEANPSLSPAEIKELLIATAEPMQDVPFERQGYGAVNAARALAAALRAPGGPLKGLPYSPSIKSDAVTFTLFEPGVKSVAVIGSFNNWQPRGYEMREISSGVWQLTIPRPPPGRYQYKFLLEGPRWTKDPENPERIDDGYGDYSSLLTVAEDASLEPESEQEAHVVLQRAQ